MTNKNLIQLANKISQKYFKENVKGKVAFNYRMRTNTAGFTYRNNNAGEITNWKISINPLTPKYFGKTGVIKALKNEIILDYQIQNNLSCGFNANFNRIAKKINAPIMLKKLHPSNSQYYVYQCTHCFHPFLQKSKINTNVYACANKITNAFGKKRACDGKLICVGKVYGYQLRGNKNNALTQAKHRAKLFKNYKHRMFARFRK